MKTAVLEKMDVQRILNAPQEEMTQIPDAREELAAEAAQKLGYGVMLNAIKSAEKTATDAQTRKCKEREVLQTLSEIGPDAIPFDLASVKKYKEEMIEEDKPFLLRHGFSKNAAGMIAPCIAFLFAASLIATLYGMVDGLMEGFLSHQWFILELTLAVGLPVTSAILLPLAKVLLPAAEYSNLAYWGRSPICEYPEQVPEFALGTALAIAEKLPEAKFHVEYLVVEKPKPDPFLVMTVDDLSYYLEVWNEPDFKAGRIA